MYACAMQAIVPAHVHSQYVPFKRNDMNSFLHSNTHIAGRQKEIVGESPQGSTRGNFAYHKNAQPLSTDLPELARVLLEVSEEHS